MLYKVQSELGVQSWVPSSGKDAKPRWSGRGSGRATREEKLTRAEACLAFEAMS